MTGNPQELDQILSDWEFEVFGTPKHWDKTTDRLELDAKLKQSLLDWHNKQIEEVLERLIEQQWSFGENDDALAVPTRYIIAERNKLKGGRAMTDGTQELEEILEGVANEYSAGGNYENAKPLMVEEAEQAVLDWHNERLEEFVDEIRSLELDDYDDTDPYQQGYMWAVGKAKTVAIEAERNKLEAEL